MPARVARALLLALVVSLVAASVGVAQRPTQLSADFAKTGTLVDGGQAVDLRVTVRCPSGYRVLEAFAYVTQDGNQSQFAGIPVVCDGKRHTFTVRVRAFDDAPFRKGAARASGYVLVEDPQTGATQQVSPTGVVKLK